LGPPRSGRGPSLRNPSPANRSSGGEEPPDSSQVIEGGAHDVYPGIGVVDPIDWNLMDAQAVPFGEDEELGVEEPVVVLDQRQQEPSCLPSSP
jgi:hypothetical protein